MKMRILAVAILCVLITGCATHPRTVQTAPASVERLYTASPSGALAFDPPVLAGDLKLDLSREPREPAAFAGFEGPSTTFYDIHVDDRQINGDWSPRGGWDNGDRYERRAISDRVGVNSR